jgi:hypothetical protein
LGFGYVSVSDVGFAFSLNTINDNNFTINDTCPPPKSFSPKADLPLAETKPLRRIFGQPSQKFLKLMELGISFEKISPPMQQNCAPIYLQDNSQISKSQAKFCLKEEKSSHYSALVLTGCVSCVSCLSCVF